MGLRPSVARPPLIARGGVATLLRETFLWSAPALTGLVILSLVEGVGALGVIAGGVAGLILAAFLALKRLQELDTIATWIEHLPFEQTGIDPEAAEGTLADRLLRPVAELARQVRRQARRAAAQQRILASVIDAYPDPLLVVDAEPAIVHANTAALRGLDGTARGVPLSRVVRDPGLLAAVNAALAAEAASNVTFSPPLDRTKQFTSRIEPVDLGDRGKGVLIALREQTEQVMIERMRSDFVANASHEIRTPLAAIQGIIETLKGPARHDPSARAMFLDLMAEEAARMTRLVDDLLSLSRTELSANQPPTERCDLAAILSQVLDRMRPLAERVQVEIEASMAAALPPLVGDADQLFQLFANLVDNAIKYGGEGKTVTVAAKALEAAPEDCGPATGRPCLQVDIADQGPGIAKEHLPRLTERFYRVDTARSRRLRGTGLGLAIVKHILRRHQGHLGVTSELAQGSVFTVFLPTA